MPLSTNSMLYRPIAYESNMLCFSLNFQLANPQSKKVPVLFQIFLKAVFACPTIFPTSVSVKKGKREGYVWKCL